MEIRKHKKLFIFISIIVILFLLSGSFTIYDNSLTFKYTNTVKPYSPGTYMNYTVCGGKDLLMNNHPSGYINVTSFQNYISIKTGVRYFCDYYVNGSYAGHSVLISVYNSIKILKKNNNLFFNNTQIVLPFFYSGKILSHYKSVYENASYVSYGMINQNGIFEYHAGHYISPEGSGHVSSNDEYILNNSEKSFHNFTRYNACGFYAYDAHSELLNDFSGNNVIINYLLGLLKDENGSYYPLPMNVVLNKTNTIVFPVDYVYVAAVYAVLVFATGFFIIIPAAVILGLMWYRRRKKR